MGYSTASAEWPKVPLIDDSVKHLIDSFFKTADENDEEAGIRFAEHFTESAVMNSPHGDYSGRSGLIFSGMI